MVQLSIRVTGQPGVRNALRRVGRGVRAGAAAAAQESAARIAEEMRRLVPVDTGELYNSIEVEQISELTYAATATAPHAPYVELGTIHMAAQPFMVPAAELERAEFGARIGARIREEVT